MVASSVERELLIIILNGVISAVEVASVAAYG
jgi:hypothetical protein